MIPSIFPSLRLKCLIGLRRAGQTVVDGTLGGGGHTRLLAEAVGSGGRVIALDRDAAALARAERELAGLPVMISQSNFCELPEVLAVAGVDAVDGILLDLGLSSDQLADDERGFSFDSEGLLDLRFDDQQGEPAWRLLQRLREENLANLIYEYGEERHSRRIAREIVARRHGDPIRTARQLSELVRRCTPRGKGPTRDRIHPATRTFQALRIAVNDELKSLELALARLPECLREGGRLAIISFHSLEDRRVKEAFRDDDRLTVLTRKPIRPGDEEVDRNPRSRSAKLRVAARGSPSLQGGVRGGSIADLKNLPQPLLSKEGRVVSGGQTGVDRAALDVATEVGIPHGGWCPRGRKAEDGAIPDRYKLQETDSPAYHIRTQQNVIDSDGTLILYRDELRGGTKLTHRLAIKHGRPALLVNLRQPVEPADIRAWIIENNIQSLNIAGPRESSELGIYEEATVLLRRVLQRRDSQK